MRFLFVALPAAGHLLPLIPFAWAARAAGHEVLFGSNGRGIEICVQAGLAVHELAPGVDVMAALRKGFSGGGSPPRTQPGGGGLPAAGQVVAGIFAAMNGQMTDGLLAIARHWHPDVVVHGPTAPFGGLVAEAMGIPAVMHGLGITLNGRGLMEGSITEGLTDTRERLGLAGQLAVPSRAILDTSPPSMSLPAGPLPRTGPESADGAPRWAMRYVPYNGGKELPDWLLAPPTRPRVCVTLGTALPRMAGVGGLKEVLAATGRLDVEVVLALGEVDLAPLGPLPDGVRVAGWMPLASLVPTCAAIVHHGGSGTTMNALASGVPQLVIPHFADQPMNAAAVAARGVGLAIEPEAALTETLAEALARLLGEASFAVAAGEVRDEIATMPTPAAIVARLEGWKG